jgi:diguanylate cyclase (GGDEF)-like protein
MSNRLNALENLDARIDLHLQDNKSLGVLLVRLLRVRELQILFGYALGIRLVETAIETITAVLRPQDEIVQLGENEFVLLLPDLLSPNHAVLAAHRVVRTFQRPVPVDGHGILATVAVGIALAPDHGNTADALCRRADIAFGEARRSGDSVALYTPVEQLLDVPYGELRHALEQGQLDVHLQPILDLRNDRVIGAESLARWTSPGLGAIRPDIFVPVAERTGLIGEMTRWSVNVTLRHTAIGQFAGRGMHVSINLSPRVFLDHSFADQMLSALKIWDVPPQAVVLEVTEGAMMEDPVHSASVLRTLREQGISIAVDDFGTGYSSFSYLRKFPANEVKIDQTFIMEMSSDPRTAQLVRSMIELAHRLDMRVVAEGVEDQETLDLLRGMDCDFAQGFHIGRPQPAEQFIESLATTPLVAT